MMKKILAVLLLGCLLCLALAGCGKTDLDKSQEYMDKHPLEQKKLYSVSFCLVSDDAIDAVTMNTISENFNRFTEANYGIHVEFTNVTAAQYATWLENRFTAVEAANAARVAAEAEKNAAKAELERIGKDAEATTEAKLTATLNYDVANAAFLAKSENWSDDVVAEINALLDAAREALENGNTSTATSKLKDAELAVYNHTNKSNSGAIGSDIRDVYPDIADYQFDVIYIANYDMLASLVRAGRIRDLTAEMTSNEYRLIKKQMTEKFFEASKLAGKIYAIPNCRLMDNYKYLRVKADVATYYNLRQKDLSDYSSTKMLRDVITAEGGDAAANVVKDIVGDYNYRYELAEDGAWWVYASASEQLPAISQSDLMNGMLAVTAYAYVDDNGTVTTTDDDFCPAVRILYAVNTEATLQSTLRYGAYTSTVVVDGNTRVTVVTPQADYNQNSKYTGNIFALYPTQEEYENKVQAGSRTQNNETKISTDIYTISAKSATEGCTATVSSDFAKVGETIVFTATPAEGYTFTQWVYKTEEGEEEVRSTSAVYNYVVTPTNIELIAQFEGSAAPVDEEPGD